jgi:hypothetical protein
MVVEHKHAIGFEGTILIEPKPFEPTKHQYDYDVAAVHAFLQRYDLEDEVKVNIEVNHATLAGVSADRSSARSGNDRYNSRHGVRSPPDDDQDLPIVAAGAAGAVLARYGMRCRRVNRYQRRH